MGSAGGVGGGGIYVPMLTLIIGFDPKSAAAMSKCMIMGAAGSTVYYNLWQKHPTMDKPLIDYDLALLFQPMLMLGISIGVAFNIIFADWMITLLLIILFLVTSTKAVIRGLNTWKKESLHLIKTEAAKELEPEGKQSAQVTLQMTSLTVGEKETAGNRVEASKDGDKETTHLLTNGSNSDCKSQSTNPQHLGVLLSYNIQWAELSLMVFVWVAFFVIQIMKTYFRECSVEYWILNILQVPVAVSVTLFEAISLYTGKRSIATNRKEVNPWSVEF